VIALAVLAIGLAVGLPLYLPGSAPFEPPTFRATLADNDRDRISFVVFSPDSTTLASGGSAIKLWDVGTGECVSTLEDSKGHVSSAVFSSDGKTLASGINSREGDAAIKLWDLTTRKPKATYSAKKVVTVAFRPDGTLLAAGYWDGKITVQDVKAKQEIAVFDIDGLWAAAFSPDGKSLATGSSGGMVRLWDLERGNMDPVAEWDMGPWSDVSRVAFSPDGKTLAAGGATDVTGIGGGSGCAVLWNMSSRKSQPYYRASDKETPWISCIAFNPDGKILVGGTEWGKVEVWEVNTAKPKATLGDFFYGRVTSLAFSPDGRLLAAGFDRGEIKLWNVPHAR
jgi:WD40 repeat protein